MISIKKIEEMVDGSLVAYINQNLVPMYNLNDTGHQMNHINQVLQRSFDFALQVQGLDYNIVYTIALLHDIKQYENRKLHHILSAKFAAEDEFLKSFFTKKQLITVVEGIEDHRASNKDKPRSIYGEIVSSADRTVDIREPFYRTHSYTLKHVPNITLEDCILRAFEALKDKFGTNGYANEKMYFVDEGYKKFISGLQEKLCDYDAFKEEYLVLNNIDEYEYYTVTIDPILKAYIDESIFPLYVLNDKAHGIVHIKEVVKRCIHLNREMSLNLNENMLFAIAAYHDLGKYENRELHNQIAANRFSKDEFMKNYFSAEEQEIIYDAIYDHRASKKDNPKTTYGKAVSSADRNTSIEIVFKRSFWVGLELMSDISVQEFLDYTQKRLSKKYSLEEPENMFYEDEIYKNFLAEMRSLLENKEAFYEKYMLVNNIKIDKMMKDYVDVNDALKQQILRFEPYDEQEAKDKELFLQFLTSFDDVLTRKNVIGHFTSSAMVLNKAKTKMLVVNHNIFKGYIFPGGHADGDHNLLNVAMKEVFEETGVETTHLGNEILSIQSIAIDAHYKKGKFISPHLHLNVIYLLEADENDLLTIAEEENSDVKWVDLDKSFDETFVGFARPINEKNYKKIRGK